MPKHMNFTSGQADLQLRQIGLSEQLLLIASCHLYARPAMNPSCLGQWYDILIGSPLTTEVE